MPRRIVGQLQTPAGTPQAGAIRIVARDKNAALQLLGNAADIDVDGTGNYDFTLQDGNYIIQFSALSRFVEVGKVTVTDGGDVTLNQLVNL